MINELFQTAEGSLLDLCGEEALLQTGNTSRSVRAAPLSLLRQNRSDGNGSTAKTERSILIRTTDSVRFLPGKSRLVLNGSACLIVSAAALPGLYQCAADATPVRSGRARANWRCSIGAPQYTSDETTGLDANRAQEAFRDSAAGDVLYVTNSVPYIGRLEAGSSVQAPSGIAGNAVAACTANIESGAYLP